jgi:hypothetical protein
MKNHQDTFMQQNMALHGAIGMVRRECPVCREKKNCDRILQLALLRIQQLRKMDIKDKAKLNEIFGRYE